MKLVGIKNKCRIFCKSEKVEEARKELPEGYGLYEELATNHYIAVPVAPISLVEISKLVFMSLRTTGTLNFGAKGGLVKILSDTGEENYAVYAAETQKYFFFDDKAEAEEYYDNL